MQEQKGIQFIQQATSATAETYEARKKAFKAAGRHRGSQHIPMTRNNQTWEPTAAGGNNRKEANRRKVNPRMLNIQRSPVQVKVHGTATIDGKKVPVVAKVKTMGMKKIYHTRPVVLPVVVPPVSE